MNYDSFRPDDNNAENNPYQSSSSHSYNSGYPQPIPSNAGPFPHGEDPLAPNSVPRPPKKKRFWPKAVALCLSCAILGGAGGAATGYYFGNAGKSNVTTIYKSEGQPNLVDVANTSYGKELTLSELYETWVNSCVGISTEIVTSNIFGQQIGVGTAAGSGFIVSADGYILTNYHVISGASSIKVTFYDGTEYDATLVGGEESNDVAVLKIEAEESLTPIVFGNSDNLRVGETVSTIGNPLGEMTFSQTSGSVSALNRSVTMSDGTVMNMIQTDCTINSGNSGGPLFNSSGEVIGITSAKFSNNGSSSEATIEGIGFAIPINDVIDLVQDIIQYGYVTGKPSAGVLLDEVEDAVLRYGIPDGAIITAVLEGSGADKGGIQEDDIITAVDDEEISSVAELQSLVGKHRAGDTVTFSVYRSGQTLELSVTLDEYDQAREDAMNALNQELKENQQQTTNSNEYYYIDPDYGFSYSWPFGR